MLNRGDWEFVPVDASSLNISYRNEMHNERDTGGFQEKCRKKGLRPIEKNLDCRRENMKKLLQRASSRSQNLCIVFPLPS